MKTKAEKPLSKKIGHSDFETFKFLSAVNKNKSDWKSERYRIILDCGYEEREGKYPIQLVCPKPMGEVVRFQNDLKLLANAKWK